MRNSTPTPGRPLTERQREFLRTFAVLSVELGYAPTMRSLCAAMGFRSTNATRDHAVALAKRGLLAFPERRGAPNALNRSRWRLTPAGWQESGVARPVDPRAAVVEAARAFVAWLGTPTDPMPHQHADILRALAVCAPRAETCAHCDAYDAETLDAIGPECGRTATQILHWRDGRVSPACAEHGVDSLQPSARTLLRRIEPLSACPTQDA